MLNPTTGHPSKRANKRLKVGRACYTCRAKKIKCDGLRPCMQCKARQRPCSFYKDGSLELDEEESVKQQSETSHNVNVLSVNDSISKNIDNKNEDDRRSSSSSANPNTATVENTDQDDDSRILFADTSAANHNKLKRRGPLMESRISNILGSLGEEMRKLSSGDSDSFAGKLLDSADSFGNFIMWMPEPSLPSRYSGSIEMPTREIQMALVDQFFSERYESIGLIPRSYFYGQLETKGLLITPLLLNTIYAHASRFVKIPDCPKTEVFYQRARRLVDDFMDVPRVSTIVALCLLSLYEPSPAIYRPGPYHCRQWQYSGMACRMALELGLYDDSNVHSSLAPVEIETRRRVFWGCYDLDKFQSGGWERPWMISQSFIKTAPPSPLPEETEDEKYILNVYVYRMKFMSILEEGLLLVCASQSFQSGGSNTFLGIRKEEMLSNMAENHAKYQQWLRSLPPDIQWTPIAMISVKDVFDLPAPRPMIAHVHLYYNVTALELLIRIPSNSLILFQSRVTAACMTQLVYHLCQVPSFVTKFDFLVHALIAAIKIHLQYLDDVDINLAQQAWVLFDRSIWCMQLINTYAVIPNCTKFLQQVQNIYGLNISMPNNCNMNKAGDKAHVASPSPKRPRASTSTSIRQQSVSPPISHPQQTKSIPLTEDSHRRNGKSRRGIDSSLSVPTQYANNLNHNIPSYLTNWGSTAASHSLEQQEQQHQNSNMQLRGTSNNSQNVVYLDQQYGFSNEHHRGSSANFPLLNTYKQPNINKGNTTNRSNQLWNHQRHQSTGSIVFEQHYNMDSTHEYQQSRVNRNDSNSILGYNSNEIVVPSQLMVDERTDNTIYQTPSTSSTRQQQPLNDTPSSSTSNYAQQLPSSNNIIWQDHTVSMNSNSSSNTDQNMNMTGDNEI